MGAFAGAAPGQCQGEADRQRAATADNQMTFHTHLSGGAPFPYNDGYPVRFPAAPRPNGMNKIKFAGLLFSIGAVATAAVLLSQNHSLATGVATGQPAPAAPATAPGWDLTDLDGKTVHSADLKGRVVVLDFWATWCPPCRAEIPGFIALQKQYQAQGLAVVGVSVDQSSAASVKAFVQEQGINYPVVRADDQVVAAFGGIDGLPATFIVDRTGRIVKQHLGYTDQSEIEKEILPLLKP